MAYNYPVISSSEVTPTEGATLAGVTSAIQTQMDTRTKTLFVGTADVSVTNTGTEGTLVPSGVGSVTIGADTLAAGTMLKIVVKGLLSSAAVPGTLADAFVKQRGEA